MGRNRRRRKGKTLSDGIADDGVGDSEAAIVVRLEESHQKANTDGDGFAPPTWTVEFVQNIEKIEPSDLLGSVNAPSVMDIGLQIVRGTLERMSEKKHRQSKNQSSYGVSSSTVKLTPSPVQLRMWPALLTSFESNVQPNKGISSAWNVVGIAQTGSGKTMAYVIPIISCCVQRLLHQFHSRTQSTTSETSVHGVVMVPTRELAIQVSKEFDVAGKVANKLLSKATESQEVITEMKVESVAIYGGVDVQTQIQQLGFSGRLGKKGNSRRLLNVAATSGRLLDILKQCAQRDDASGVESTSVASAFSSTQIFVFDEADRIAVNPEMSLQVDEILSILKDERDDDDITTCIVSATLPEKAKETCDKWVRLPRVVVKVGSVKVAEKKRTDDDSTKDVSAIAGDTRTKLPDDLDLASIPSHIVQTLHVCSTHKKPKKLILTLQRIYAKPKNPHGGRSSTNNKLCIVFFAQIKTLKFASKLLAKEGMLL